MREVHIYFDITEGTKLRDIMDILKGSFYVVEISGVVESEGAGLAHDHDSSMPQLFAYDSIETSASAMS